MPHPPGYQVLIDGYNVLLQHAAPRSSAELEQLRGQFVQALQGLRWPMPVVRVTVVFDSREPHSEGLASGDRVRVQFAHPSADAWIQDALRHELPPHTALVISDDREILSTARDLGARCESTAWLRARLTARLAPGKAARAAGDGDKSLPAATARQLRDELLKRWRADAE